MLVTALFWSILLIMQVLKKSEGFPKIRYLYPEQSHFKTGWERKTVDVLLLFLSKQHLHRKLTNVATVVVIFPVPPIPNPIVVAKV